jgi:HEPN domain-containing protein
MKQRELVQLLLHKAAQDQAVLKALLTHLGVSYPRIHRLETLAELLQAHGKTPPLSLRDLMRLTPFGTVFRYDDIPLNADVTPREMLEQVQTLRVFVESQIS